MAGGHGAVAGRGPGSAVQEGCGGARRLGARAAGAAPVSGNKWLQIAMIRMNHNGTRMDAEEFNTNGPGNVSEVVAQVKQVRAEGMGVISMSWWERARSRPVRTGRPRCGSPSTMRRR